MAYDLDDSTDNLVLFDDVVVRYDRGLSDAEPEAVRKARARARLSAQTTANEDSIQSVANRTEVLETHADSVDGTLENTGTALRNLESESETQGNELNSLSQDQLVLENRVADNEDGVSAVGKAVEETTSKANRNAEDISSAVDRVSGLEATTSSQQEEIDNRATLQRLEQVESDAEASRSALSEGLQTEFTESLSTTREEALDASKEAMAAADSSGLNLAVNDRVGNAGEFRVFGNTKGVPDFDKNAEISWNGNVYEIERSKLSNAYTGLTGADPRSKGFIAFDLNDGNTFLSDNGEVMNVAFVRNSDGQWQYDDNSNWIDFLPSEVVALGWMEAGGDEIYSSGLFGKPVSLGLASYPSADVTGDNTAHNTVNVGDRSADDVNNKLDTVEEEVSTKATIDRVNEVESDAESARGQMQSQIQANYQSEIENAKGELQSDIVTRATEQELADVAANSESARANLQTTLQSSFNDQFASVQQDIRTKADADSVESLYTIRVQGQTSDGTPVMTGLSIGTNGESSAVAIGTDTFSVVQPDGSEIPAFVVDTANNRTVQNEAVIGTVNFTKLIDSSNNFIVDSRGRLKAQYIDVDNLKVNYNVVVGGPPSNADRTADNTAKSIRNQGYLATRDNADWKTDITGSGKPEDNAQANAAGTLNIIANVDHNGNKSEGEILLFGSRNGKPDQNVDGFVSFKGIKRTIPRGTNYTITTGANRSKGFLVADLTDGNRFRIKNFNSRCAFVRKSTVNWQYDNGSSWVNFDIHEGTVAAIGWMEAGDDYVYAYGLFGAPIDLEVSSMPGADVTAESTAKDTANVGDRPSSQVLDDVDTSKSLANESINQIIKGAENKVRKPTFEDEDVGGWRGGTDVSSDSDSLITTRRATTEEHRFSVMPGQRLFCAMSVFTKQSNYTVKIGIRTNTGKYIEGAGLTSGKSFTDVNGSLVVPDDATSAQAYILIDGYDNNLGRAYVKNLYIGSSQLGADRTDDNESKSTRSGRSGERVNGKPSWEFNEDGSSGIRGGDSDGSVEILPTGVYIKDGNGNLRIELGRLD